MKKIIITFLLIGLFSLQAYLKITHTQKDFSITKQESVISFTENFARFIHFGHGRLLAAVMWVSTLIESDVSHYNKKGENSWMFHRFNSIRIFDPLFYENYLYGGQYLSVIKDDVSGATYVYDLGLVKYENDFWLNYHAGFHYYFEANDREKAIISYDRVSKHKDSRARFPALPTLLAKLKVEHGDTQAAYEGLRKSYLALPKDNKFRPRFRQTLYSIKAKIDLDCLNSIKLREDCDHLDFDNSPYRKKKGLYVENRDLLKIYLKK